MFSTGLLTVIHNTNERIPGHGRVYEEFTKFNIYFVQNAYFIWDIDAIMRIRSTFGIVGKLVGVLPRKTRQNKVFGLPLEVFKEEAFLLLNFELARIVKLQELPFVNGAEKFDACLMDSYLRQNEYLQKSIFQKSQRFVDEPVEVPPHLDLTKDIDLNKPPYHLQRKFHRQLSEFWTSSYNAINEIALCDYEKKRAIVLHDLSKRKYQTTSGDKFGGDFLSYPGDPLVYHAYFVVKVCCAHSAMRSLDLLTISRLASSVRKIGVLAFVKDENVSYISLQWSGLK